MFFQFLQAMLSVIARAFNAVNDITLGSSSSGLIVGYFMEVMIGFVILDIMIQNSVR